MEVSGLFIYPVKSLQGISLQEAEVRERGFVNDRRWMIVDENHVALTQRTHALLSQIDVSLNGNTITLTHEQSHVTLEKPADSAPTLTVEIWGDVVQAKSASETNNRWISSIVGAPCKFVFMSEYAARPVDKKRAKNNENVSFADGAPYLIIGESSLADLNSRMEKALPMNRFRPNIVVTGSTAYEEDNWQELKVGDVDFYGTHPCKRCVFTTIDQETGEKSAEPLKTLATYRKEGSSVIFGLNTLAASEGAIKIGDPIKLL